MIKTIFLVPARDNEGHEFPPSAWQALEDRLLDLCGGFSVVPAVRGAWRSEERVYQDVSRQYGVSLESWEQLPAWLEVIRWVGHLFRQEAIYAEVAGIPEIFHTTTD